MSRARATTRYFRYGKQPFYVAISARAERCRECDPPCLRAEGTEGRYIHFVWVNPDHLESEDEMTEAEARAAAPLLFPPAPPTAAPPTAAPPAPAAPTAPTAPPAPTAPTARRPVCESVDWFAQRMEQQLSKPANEAKGGWGKDSLQTLLERLHEEAAELGDALHLLRTTLPGDLSGITPQDVIAEAADIANFAMMIADNVRRGALK